MEVRRPRTIKWIDNIRSWWKYRNAPLTLSINDEGVLILGGVVNQRIIADCTVGVGKDLYLRKELSTRSMVNAGGGTWTAETNTLTLAGSFENEQ